MTIGTEGLKYELKVYDAIKKADVFMLEPGDKPGAGFSNVGAGDIEGKYFGKPFNIEIKLSSDDQMGGSSFRYDMPSKKFTPVKQMDASDLDLLLSAVKDKTKDIDAYIKASHKLPPVSYHKKNTGIPITVSKEGRDILKNQGLLKNINTKVKTTAQFIEKHYNKKGVYYIQVGGAGLFYLGRNPFNLPIPRLNGEIDIEIRLAFSGSVGRFPDGTETRSAGLRFQGRMKTKNTSPHSLDSVDGVRTLFNEVISRVKTL